MAPTILSMLPEKFGTLIEPFAGGAAVSLASGHGKFILNDINMELIVTYEMVAFKLDEVIRILRIWENSPEEYTKVRSMYWPDLPAPWIAARFIYLNRLCVKGLYRVNKSGGFNVPYDHTSSKKLVVDEYVLRQASEVFKKAEVMCGDFVRAMGMAKPGDVVFCDPPYVPFSKNGFVNYSATGFNENDHAVLADKVKDLYRAGISVILTNSNTSLVRELYIDFPIVEVATRNNMNTSGRGESSYTELVVDARVGGIDTALTQ